MQPLYCRGPERTDRARHRNAARQPARAINSRRRPGQGLASAASRVILCRARRVLIWTLVNLSPNPDVMNAQRGRVEMAEISDVTDTTFEGEVLQSDKPVLVDFWAEWCAPCRAIAPIVKEIADDHSDKLKVVKVNIDDSPQTPGTYGIRSIPTVLVFKDGQVVSQLTGARPKGDFEELVAGVL